MELLFTMKNYGTMEKTMVLWTKLWYYTENYGTSIYEEKNKEDYQKLRDFDLKWKKLWKNTKIIEVLFRFLAFEL